MAFTDQSTTFVNNGLLTHQQMDAMAENDKFFYDFRTNLVAFSAYPNANQTIPVPITVPGKLTFNSTEWDTHSAFDTANSRFIVPVAGKYLLLCTLQQIELSAFNWNSYLYRNGSLLHNFELCPVSTNPGGGEAWGGIDVYAAGASMNMATIVNATVGQYFEIWSEHSLVAQTIAAGPVQTYFQGFLIQKTP